MKGQERVRLLQRSRVPDAGQDRAAQHRVPEWKKLGVDMKKVFKKIG
jgi:hypothetical protein